MLRFSRSLAVLTFLLPSLSAQDVAGDWRGHIEVPGAPLQVEVHLAAANGTWSGTIDIPAQHAKALPLQDVRVKGVEVTFAIADTPGEPTFRGRLAESGDRIAGDFTQGGQRLAFTLERAAAAAAKHRAAFDDMPAWLDATRAMFDVPGVAVAVVQRGEVLATFASGQRDVAHSLPVDADTLFAIGSSTKAFTTCLLAMLVDDGRLDWEAPVRRWLPDFALTDTNIAERMTPRDLVTHRSGMPRHDLVWYGADVPRAELVARLRHLPLSHDLRTDFQYNNLMFVAAGHLAERLTGNPWEDAVRTRILTPLGMTRTGFRVAAMQQDADHAVPYRKHAGRVVATPYRDITAVGPAGSINSSVREMANWVALQLQGGEFHGKRLLAAASAADLHVVRMPTAGPATGDDADVLDIGYALGWMVDVYRGHRRVHHGGNIDGFSAMVSLLPDDGFGFVVLTNLDATPLTEVVARNLADRALGLEPHDFRAVTAKKRERAEQQELKGKTTAQALRRTGTQPSHAVDDYVGDYVHPGYGTCRVTRVGDGLHLDLHGLACDLEHWHFDVFAGREGAGESVLADSKWQFLLDVDGEIEAVRAALEPSTAPIVFARAADPRFAEAAFRQRLAGRYALDTAIATIHADGPRLVVTLPGQRHELEPLRGLSCQLRGLPGYRLEFVLDADGAPIAVRFHQPDGVFVATRRAD